MDGDDSAPTPSPRLRALASLTVARHLVQRAADGMRGVELVDEMLRDGAFDTALALAGGSAGSPDLRLEDVCAVPLFGSHFSRVRSFKVKPGVALDTFWELLGWCSGRLVDSEKPDIDRVASGKGFACAVISCEIETFAIFVVVTGPSAYATMVFDPVSRLPQTAATTTSLMQFDDLVAMSAYLVSIILPERKGCTIRVVTDDVTGKASEEILSSPGAPTRPPPAKETKEKEERSRHKSTPRRTFHCGICLENRSQRIAVKMDSCSHEFCRSCTVNYLISKLQTKTFPILCPTCVTVDQGDDAPIGIVTDGVVEKSGCGQTYVDQWQSLVLSQFSVEVECRWCGRSTHIDREDWEGADFLCCPLPACDHRWCKNCLRTVDANGVDIIPVLEKVVPRSRMRRLFARIAATSKILQRRKSKCSTTSAKHKCTAGAHELDKVMHDEGWKYCPKCTTPTEKVSGCNHMTCGTPGCSTHFCYICGLFLVGYTSARNVPASRLCQSH